MVTNKLQSGAGSGVQTPDAAVPETTTGEKNRQVLGRMITGISQVAAEKDHRSVEQGFVVFLRLLQFIEQFLTVCIFASSTAFSC
jgi:hypothetical protein